MLAGVTVLVALVSEVFVESVQHAAVTFGMTSLAALAKYEPFRPVFGGVTALLLALAFFATYRRPAEACEPGSICATRGVGRIQKINRFVLWLATAVAVIVFTFPTWSGWILG